MTATFKFGTNKYSVDLAEKLGIVEAIPRKTSTQRNRSNIPSSSPIDNYKKSGAIPLLDSLIIQMQDRFSDEDRHARHSLYLVLPSIIVNNTLELSEATEGLLFWENDFLPFPNKSLGNELRIKMANYVAVSREGTSKQSSTSMHLTLFQTSIVFFSLHAPYQSVVQKLSGPFRS